MFFVGFESSFLPSDSDPQFLGSVTGQAFIHFFFIFEREKKATSVVAKM
jgi:hypothetical protein